MELLTLLSLLPLLYLLFLLYKMVSKWRDQYCYMLHYECYKATQDRTLNTELCADIVNRNTNLGLEEYKFLLQTIVNSGIGEETYAPRNFIEEREQSPTLDDAISDMDDILFETLDNLFSKARVSPTDVDILVVNVSLLSTVPSLTTRVINRYKMREDVKAFHLAGMGCSASLVAIDLVQHLFKTHMNALAVVVSTESMAPNWYCGKERSMMLSNCLFRSGGCSMLFTNKQSLKHQAMLKLKTMVRTHIGSNDEAYKCCMQVEDDLDFRGFRLTKKLTASAAIALTQNLKILLPKVLPLRELIPYVIVSYWKTKSNPTKNLEKVGSGLNLKTVIKHFCIHPGGKAVINGVGKSLSLSDYDLEPARMALHRWGNTSSGGLWYVLGYMEVKKRLMKGDQILMISLGAGFKCNNCVWEVMRNLKDDNVWKDCVDRYPPEKKQANTFMEKYGWIYDDSLRFTKIEQNPHLRS